MYGLKRVIPVIAAAFVAALPVVVSAQGPTWTSSKIEKYNGYDYELWNQDNKGTVSMKLTGDNGSGASAVGGTFEATWKNTQNVLFRSGRKFTGTSGQSVDGSGQGKPAAAIGNITINFAATWNSGDNVKMLGVYGWAFFASGSVPTKQENGTSSNFSNQIEYYIIQDRGSYNSATSGTNSKKYGSATIDGIDYDFYVCDRINQPMLTGNGNFKQYFSVPQSTSKHRTSGTISVSKHFSEWVKLGMKMDGPLYEVAMKVESYNGSSQSDGSAKVTKNILTIGDPIPAGNFTLTTAASPINGGTVTMSPNSDSYSPNASVQVTAKPTNSSWQFDGWSGDASGTTNPVTVTMNANKSVTAKFKLVGDDTTNLIRDGKFSGGTGSNLGSDWGYKTGSDWGGSAGSATVTSGKVKLTITTAGSKKWEPQLVQEGVPLEKGAKYRLTFTASAGAARSMDVGFNQSVDPWQGYTEETYALTTADQNFSSEFEMTYASDPNTNLSINVGGSGTAGTNVTISNVRLVRIAAFGNSTGLAPDRRLVSPSVKPSLRAAQSSSGVKVSFKAAETGAATLRLYSLKGDVLSAVNLQTVSGKSYTQTLRSSGKLPSGFYMVGLQHNGGAVERMAVLVQ
ncbi:endo-1,4-beta-xylanase [Fibrobacteres bacterium R8-0-B4]